MSDRSQALMGLVVIAAACVDCGIIYGSPDNWMFAHVVLWSLTLAFCMVVISLSDLED